MLRPADLSDPARMREHSDQYLFDLIKHGGAPIGRPGMPGFGAVLTDQEIAELVALVRQFSGSRAP
jgi:mono/diheme cytochrome c family protein